MANPGYLRSTDGDDADTGATWALANATAVGAMADAAAGDRIWVSQAHAETQASGMTITLPGTIAAPTQLLCGSDAAEPPTALATTGTITTTGAFGLTVNGNGYIYGLTFSCASGATSQTLLLGGNGTKQVYEECGLINAGTGASAAIAAGLGSATTATETELINCQLKLASTGSRVVSSGKVRIRGGSVIAGGSTPTSVFSVASTAGRAADLQVDGFDFSGYAATVNLVLGGATGQAGNAVFRNCKLPASWSGGLVSTTITTPGFRAEMYNCDSVDTNYQLWVEDYAGSTKHETTIIATGGASDGTTGLSWKMDSSANAEYPVIQLESPEIVRWNETTGSALTATVEIVHDTNVAAGQGAGTDFAFQDDEIWLEVQYLGTAGFPLSVFGDDSKADILATAADQTTSSAAWTTTGMTTPVKQKLSVTFTPQEKGFIHAKVVMAKASKTVYIDPKLTVA